MPKTWSGYPVLKEIVLYPDNSVYIVLVYCWASNIPILGKRPILAVTQGLQDNLKSLNFSNKNEKSETTWPDTN